MVSSWWHRLMMDNRWLINDEKWWKIFKHIWLLLKIVCNGCSWLTMDIDDQMNPDDGLWWLAVHILKSKNNLHPNGSWNSWICRFQDGISTGKLVVVWKPDNPWILRNIQHTCISRRDVGGPGMGWKHHVSSIAAHFTNSPTLWYLINPDFFVFSSLIQPLLTVINQYIPILVINRCWLFRIICHHWSLRKPQYYTFLFPTMSAFYPQVDFGSCETNAVSQVTPVVSLWSALWNPFVEHSKGQSVTDYFVSDYGVWWCCSYVSYVTAPCCTFFVQVRAIQRVREQSSRWRISFGQVKPHGPVNSGSWS